MTNSAWHTAFHFGSYGNAPPTEHGAPRRATVKSDRDVPSGGMIAQGLRLNHPPSRLRVNEGDRGMGRCGLGIAVIVALCIAGFSAQPLHAWGAGHFRKAQAFY